MVFDILNTNVIKSRQFNKKVISRMNKWQIIVNNLSDAGLSQAEIANLAGCSQSQIAFLKQGKRGNRLSFEIAKSLILLDEKLKNGEIGKASKVVSV